MHGQQNIKKKLFYNVYNEKLFMIIVYFGFVAACSSASLWFDA